jgi:hypothetical protein
MTTMTTILGAEVKFEYLLWSTRESTSSWQNMTGGAGLMLPRFSSLANILSGNMHDAGGKG